MVHRGGKLSLIVRMVQREKRPSLTERGVLERRKIKLNRERDSREKKDQTE